MLGEVGLRKEFEARKKKEKKRLSGALSLSSFFHLIFYAKLFVRKIFFFLSSSFHLPFLLATDACVGI